MKLVKIITTIPKEDGDKIRKTLGDAGAGKIGKYSYCSITTNIEGRFKPLAGANPTVGEVGKLEVVKEEKIEVVCQREIAKKVIKALKKAHPYEEPIIEIHPLLTEEDL